MSSPICKVENVLRLGAGELTHYVGVVPSDAIEGITQVLVFEASQRGNYLKEITELGGQEGYQRSASKGRQNSFGDYVKKESDAVVPPVILNCRGKWSFIPYSSSSPNFGRLEIHDRANIIDGQHRIGGYINAFKKHKVICSIEFVAYENFVLLKEKYVFDTINTNAKNVPGALSAVIHSEKEENRIARRLAEEASSPFCGKISMAGNPGPQYLWKLNALAKNVVKIFRDGAFDNTPEASKYDIFTESWHIIAEEFPDEWGDIDLPAKGRQYKMLELTGLIAWRLVMSKQLAHSYNAVDDTVNWDSVRQKVGMISGRLDWHKLGKFKGQTGEYGGAQIAHAMEGILASPEEGDIATN